MKKNFLSFFTFEFNCLENMDIEHKAPNNITDNMRENKIEWFEHGTCSIIFPIIFLLKKQIH